MTRRLAHPNGVPPARAGQAGLMGEAPERLTGMLADRSYRLLKEAIMSLELAPGEIVSERALEELLDMSRTPIRAALSRLETEGLIGRTRRGYQIAEINLREYEQAYEYREACETAVVRLAIARVPKRQLDVIDELLNEADKVETANEWLEEAIDFHIELARAVENPFLVRAIQDAMQRLARVRWYGVWVDDGRERATREHREILRLIRQKRTEEAVSAMTTHIGHSRQAILTSLRNRVSASVFRGRKTIRY